MPFGIGWVEILIVLLVALLVFGPKRLPEMGRSLGRGIREFKGSVTGKDDDDDDLGVLMPPTESTSAGSTTPRSNTVTTRERDSF